MQSIARAAVAAAFVLSAVSAQAETVTDGNLSVDVFAGGNVANIVLDGSPIDSFGSSHLGCGVFSNTTAIVVDGPTASWSGECGFFDVEISIRLLLPLPSLPVSGGYETRYVFTNNTAGTLSLATLHHRDPDLEGAGGDDIAAYDASAGAVYVFDTAPDAVMAEIASTDHPSATKGWDVDTLGSVDGTFPMDNGVGPIGPNDIGTAIGFQMDLAAGQSTIVTYRTLYARGTATVPADFDFSSCSTIPATDCLPSNKGLLSFKDDADNSKDKLIWKFFNGDAATQDDFGDPTVDGDFTLCIYDANGDRVTSLHLPASMTNWQPVKTVGYKYNDASASSDGVAKAQVKGGAAGKSKITLLAKSENLPDTTLGGIATPVRVQMNSGGNPGQCFNTTLATTVSNLGTLFKAKAP